MSGFVPPRPPGRQPVDANRSTPTGRRRHDGVGAVTTGSPPRRGRRRTGGSTLCRLILTFDLGSSAIKAVLWSAEGPVASCRAELGTAHVRAGYAEQDPSSWWEALTHCCRLILSGAHPRGADVAAVAFATARETFVPVAPDGTPIGPALLWSDRRARAESFRLASMSGGAEAVRRRTGTVLDAGSALAKLAWLSAHEPERLARCRWLLGPRDLLGLRLTGAVATDETVASRSGLYELGGEPAVDLLELAGVALERLPPVLPPASVLGEVTADAAGLTGLRKGTPVVLGAGDRACEVLGAGATPEQPVVSWGTTTNASAPVDEIPDPLPPALVVSRGALNGHLLEAGLSASGQALSWLALLTGSTVEQLVRAARDVEPGSGGVVALPWFNGARAPWWREGAHAAFLGLTPSTQPAQMARAVVEAVAFDVTRSLEAIQAAAPPVTGDAELGVRTGGGGASSDLWLTILAAVTRRPVAEMRSPELSSAGASLIAAVPTGRALAQDRINPVTGRRVPDERLASMYEDLRPRLDAAATALLETEAEEGEGMGGHAWADG